MGPGASSWGLVLPTRWDFSKRGHGQGGPWKPVVVECVCVRERENGLEISCPGTGLPGLARPPSWQNLPAQLLKAAIPSPDPGHPRVIARNYPRGGGEEGCHSLTAKITLIPFSCMDGKVLNGTYKCCDAVLWVLLEGGRRVAKSDDDRVLQSQTCWESLL